MALINIILRANDSSSAVDEVHVALISFGAQIAPNELGTATSNGRFGVSTQAAVNAIRQRFGLPQPGPSDPSFDAPVARLLNVASWADVGNQTALRAAVRESLAAADGAQPQELYWLAHYAVRAGEYTAADQAVRRVPDFAPMATIAPIISVPSPWPQQPEVTHPENFYTYRRPLVDPAAVDHVAFDWSNLTTEVGNPLQRAAGPQATTALRKWVEGNQNFDKRRYAAAVAAYDACQDAVIGYFTRFYPTDITVPAGSRTEQLLALFRSLVRVRDKRPAFWESLRVRRELLSLAELEAHDTITPGNAYDSAKNFIGFQMGNPTEQPDPHKDFRETNLDAPLMTLALVLVPLARAEANRLRRQYNAVISDLQMALYSQFIGTVGGQQVGNVVIARRRLYVHLACDFIEQPFARLLMSETMLDQADAEYKARVPADPPPAQDVAQFQNLKAAQTYQQLVDLLKDEGEYVTRVQSARDQLDQQITQGLAQHDTHSAAFRTLGKDITIPTLSPTTKALPGLDRRAAPHEPMLQFAPPPGETAMRETNPRIYAALLSARARLEQLAAGLNYLGYRDDYVPAWRFQFLLDRARYFSEHAKNAQRDYLNFLNNAENEEFRELSASQTIALEKSNVQIETARVDQASLEAAAAQQSADLATLKADDAQRRLDSYLAFDAAAREAENKSLMGSLFSGELDLGIALATKNPYGIAKSGLELYNAAVVGSAQNSASAAHRAFEKNNLRLEIGEAAKAAGIAGTQAAAAQKALLVASLQRQAALLRHEFAVETLSFLRQRTLNSEQWYRLAASIRTVSDTYLRYAIELAFLAQQAYEFEADRRINVIRFDYDANESGDFLAADFLLRDLDTIENDLVVTQRQRQQQVRYVLSMAREFPTALQELSDQGKVTFSLRLEQIERRFPGLYNVRIGSVELLPVALMDANRFSVELRHLGSGQVRLKADPDTVSGQDSTSVLNVNDLPIPPDGWLPQLINDWPIKIRISGPQTNVYSGLSRQDAAAAFPIASSGQRNAFEGLAAASAWEIDMSARDNATVPGTLADMLITFTVSGYYDSELRAAIDAFKPQTTALTSFLSAQQLFPDAFYDFNRTGKMVWKVPREMLALNGDLGRLCNIGMSLRPGALDVHFSRLMTRLRVNFRVEGSGGTASDVTLFTYIPETSVTQTAPLTVTVKAAMNTATELAWDFGDGTPILRTIRSGTTPIAPAEGAHTYAKPGRYVITLRGVRDDSLSEFRIGVVVSGNQKLGDPFIVYLPRVTFDPTAKSITITAGGAVQQAGRIHWRVGDVSAEGNSATFTLKPGNYTLDFAAVRKLNFKAYGAQRYVNGLPPLPLQGLNATTNRTFDPNGNETNGTGTPPLPARNALAKRLFDKGAISPEDDWTFELIPEEVLGLPAGTAIGPEELDLSDIQDVVLAMEYEATPGGP